MGSRIGPICYGWPVYMDMLGFITITIDTLFIQFYLTNMFKPLWVECLCLPQKSSVETLSSVNLWEIIRTRWHRKSRLSPTQEYPTKTAFCEPGRGMWQNPIMLSPSPQPSQPLELENMCQLSKSPGMVFCWLNLS